MVKLPPQYRAIAPDQRGFGGADPAVKVCTSSKDSGLKGIVFRRDFQLIRFMFMQPSSRSIADAAQPAFFA